MQIDIVTVSPAAGIEVTFSELGRQSVTFALVDANSLVTLADALRMAARDAEIVGYELHLRLKPLPEELTSITYP